LAHLLGGKSPLIILPDANLDMAVDVMHTAIFFNSGQVCCAGSRVFVHEKIYDAFNAIAKKKTEAMQLSYQSNDMMATQPIVDKLQHDRVCGFLEEGKKGGATLLTGGKSDSKDGYFVRPTIFTDVKDDHLIAREEIFGPVASVLKYSTLDEVIQRANSTPYGLAASIVTQDVDVFNYIANRINAGTVWHNMHNKLVAQLPFGGFKQSGIGRDLGEYAIHEYMQIKSIITKIPTIAPDLNKLTLSK